MQLEKQQQQQYVSSAVIPNSKITSDGTLFSVEIMRSNGFCLANTETIVFDHRIPEEKERPSSTDSVEHT